jgi:hypothetical protein
MRRFRHLFFSIVIAALVAGAMPVSLALGCIPRAAPATVPCEHGGCEEPDVAENGCICIHYPSPQAPGSLAVFDTAPAPVVSAEMRGIVPAPPAAVPARGDPPDPPPPRSTPRRA